MKLLYRNGFNYLITTFFLLDTVWLFFQHNTFACL
jgi:hypothetical protein